MKMKVYSACPCSSLLLLAGKLYLPVNCAAMGGMASQSSVRKGAEGLTAAPAAAVKHNVAERDAMSDSLLINFMNFLVGACRFNLAKSADLQCKRFLARLLAGHRHRQSLRTLGQFQLADL